jgi:IS1 family transposase
LLLKGRQRTINKLSIERRAQILSMLAEGCSVRSIARMTGTDKGAILRLLSNVGEACMELLDTTMRGLTCKQLQVDEIWGFCYAKEKNVPDQFNGHFGYGDVWGFTAICADTKLMPSFHIGQRNGQHAKAFLEDLQGRLANKVQLTSDGHKMYLAAVESVFGADIDFAQLDKHYNTPAKATPENRYSPGICCGITKKKIEGNPDPKHISTSFVERANLTIRMSNRRFTRLTNGFSKKLANLEYSFALMIAHYNFCRVHQSIRVTPAMEAGIADHIWEVSELVALLDGREWKGRK